MTIDIEILRSSETMVSHVSGETVAGVEFVDAYVPRDGAKIEVVDSGRIILANEDIPNVISICQAQGLTVEQSEGV